MIKIIKKPIIFSNPRKEKLWGILSFPQKRNRVPGLIICHGFAGSKSTRKFVKLSEALAKDGIATFRFDFSGHGDSEGDFEKLSIKHEVEDLKSAYQTFVHNKKVDKEKIGILGHSMGALIAVIFQARYQKAKTLILLSPGLHQKELMKEWHSSREIKLWQKQRYLDSSKGRIGVQYLNEAQEKDWSEISSRIEIPTLLIHGNKDDDVPIKYTKEILKKLGGPKKLTLVNGADHHFESWKARRSLIALTSEWLKNHL
jgi:pimeloyl-ACP methyl ester carboxylesterase